MHSLQGLLPLLYKAHDSSCSYQSPKSISSNIMLFHVAHGGLSEMHRYTLPNYVVCIFVFPTCMFQHITGYLGFESVGTISVVLEEIKSFI